MKKFLFSCSFLALAACGSSSEEEQQIDYAAFDDAAVEGLVEQGDTEKAIEILRGQEELGIADKADYLMQAEIYDDRLDGVAAEVAVEKAREKGADVGETALIYSRALLAQKKYEEALLALEDVPQGDGADYDVLLLKADVASGQERFDEARQLFQQAIEIGPEDNAGYMGLAIVELEQGNFEAAEQHAIEAEKRAEGDPLVDYVRGSVARYQRRFDDAIEHLNKATARVGGYVPANLELAGAYIEKGMLEEARVQLDKAFAIEPRNPMIMYYGGLASAMEGKATEAEELLLLSGDLIKRYPPATRTYAHVAYTLNKCEVAQPYFERFLAVSPNDKKTVLALADCMARMNKPNKSLALLQKILDENPDDLDATIQSAGAAGQLEDLTLAKPVVRRAYDAAQATTDFNREMLNILGRRLAYIEFRTGNPTEALSILQQLHEEAPTDVATLVLLSNIEMERGNLEQAGKAATQVLEIRPQSAEGLNLLGSVAYRQRRLEEALEHFTNALLIEPNYQSASKNRALALIGLGRFDEAEVGLRPLLETAPDDGQLQGLLGRVFLEQDKIEEALPILKRAERALPRSAVIAADHAVAMAAAGFVASAISQASKAKKLAGTDTAFVAYLDNLMQGWEEREAERIAREAEAEAKAREAFKKQQEEKKKAKEAAEKEADDETNR